MANNIDMRQFAKSAGTNLTFKAGTVVFSKGDAGNCMYVVQSGVIEMVLGDKVVETCGPSRRGDFRRTGAGESVPARTAHQFSCSSAVAV